MREREHFTNGRCFAFAGGVALTTAAFSAELAGWPHPTTLDVSYGAGVTLMVLSMVWISRSYYHRNSRLDSDIPLHPKGGYESSELEGIALQQSESTRLLGRSVEGLFSATQIELLRLVKDLGDLMIEMGEEPNQWTEEGYAKVFRRVNTWRLTFQSKYESRLKNRLINASLALGERGIKDARMSDLIVSDLNFGRLQEIRSRLTILVFNENGVTLFPPRADQNPSDIFTWARAEDTR